MDKIANTGKCAAICVFVVIDERRQAAVEKIHEFSHSCLLVSTAGAFVHSWLLKIASTEGAKQ